MNIPRHVVVMGVSGSGKSTLGADLAKALARPYGEADDFHPQANVDKMAAGQPLTDTDREPWLAALADWMSASASPTVVSCSALKRAYRDRLRRVPGGVAVIHLAGPEQVIGERLRGRSGHFMPPALLDSQFADLEPLGDDEWGITLPVQDSAQDNLRAAVDWVWAQGCRAGVTPDNGP